MNPAAGDSIRPSPARRRPWMPALVAGLLGLVLYLPTLGGTFIYDDVFHAVDDPRLADEGKWREYWTEAYFPDAPDRLWRPLVSMSYAVQHRIGAGPWSFHLVNILLHALASGLVAELTRRVVRLHSLRRDDHKNSESLSTRAGLIAGLLFAAHPVHVEGVAYIVGRADSLCTAATIAAVILSLARLSPRRVIGIIACVVVALLSKEQGLLAPLMVLGAVWLKRQTQWGSHSCLPEQTFPTTQLPPDSPIHTDPRQQHLVRVLAATLLLLVAGYFLYREWTLKWWWDISALDPMIQPLAAARGIDRWLIPFAILGRAAQLFIAPVRLSPEYGYAVITPTQSMADPYLWTGFFVAISTVALLTISVFRRVRGVIYLLLCAGLTWGMVSNLATLIGVSFGERLLYLPSAFLLALAGWAWALFAQGFRRSRAAWLLLIATLCLLSLRTVTYALTWNDRLSFYEISLAQSPRAVRLAVLVTAERINRADWPGARRSLNQGLAVAPDYWKLWTQGLRIAIEEGKWDEAATWRKGAWERGAFPPDMMWLEKLWEKRGGKTLVGN